MFLAEDEKTIIRKPNLRYFARDNGVEHYVYDAAWLINFEQFMKKLDPKNMKEHYSLPRTRHRNVSVKLWNREHPRCQIDKKMAPTRTLTFERPSRVQDGHKAVHTYEFFLSV